MSAHQADGLLCVVHLVGPGIVSVAAQAIAQDDGVDAVVIEKRNEIRALGTDIQRVVAAPRHQDYGGAGIETAIDGVHLDRRVMDVDNAVDSPGHRLAHVVLLSLADLFHIEERGAGRIKSDDDTARQDRRRSIRRVIRWPRRWHSQRSRKRREACFAQRTQQPPR